MDLKIATVEDKKKWDALIANSYGGTVFHTLKYLECLESHTSTRVFNQQIKGLFFPLVAREGAVIVALYPLFVYSFHGVRIVRSGNERDSLTYLGPVFMDSDRLKPSKLQIRALILQNELDHFLERKLKAHAVYLRPSPFFPDARPYIWSAYNVQPVHTYFFDLGQGPDAIWADFNKVIRSSITIAQKNNLTIEIGGLNDAEKIYDLLNARNRTLSSKTLVLDIVKALLQENCTIFTVKQEGKMVSGVIILHYGHYAHMWIGFPRSTTDSLGANELLLWELIKWAHTKGYKILENIGGDDISTFEFKRKFNPSLKQYFKAEKVSFFFRSYKCLKQMIHIRRMDLERYCGDERK
jgi:hypothetical protein